MQYYIGDILELNKLFVPEVKIGQFLKYLDSGIIYSGYVVDISKNSLNLLISEINKLENFSYVLPKTKTIKKII